MTAAVASTDPRFAAFFNPFGWTNIGSVAVDEKTAMSLSAIYRAVSLIAGTLASLPFRSYRMTDLTSREVVRSIFDDPDPDGQTPYEWKETAFAHLLLHGRAGALKTRTAAGALVALPLVHPRSFRLVQPEKDESPKGGVWFDVDLGHGRREKLDSDAFWYVPGLSLSGQDSLGLIEYARMTLASARAGDRASGNMLENGALISGLATPDEDQDITDDVPEIRRQLNNATTGAENAGQIAVINRKLKLQPWTMTNADAQFLQQRQFSIEEISRFTGVPPHLLMQTEKQTSWGTGVEEQNRALGRTVLGPWANRFEQRASRLLAQPRWVEFDFAGLERPSPDKEIELLLKQTGGKPILTVNEARAVRNLPPVPGGNELLPPPPAAPAPPADEDGEDDDAPTE